MHVYMHIHILYSSISRCGDPLTNECNECSAVRNRVPVTVEDFVVSMAHSG